MTVLFKIELQLIGSSLDGIEQNPVEKAWNYRVSQRSQTQF